MPCKYCGKNKELYGIADFVGDVCKDCYFLCGKREKANEKMILDFKLDLKNLNLNIPYSHLLESLQSEYPVIHWNGFHFDSRRKYPKSLIFLCLTSFKTPEMIEIFIVNYQNEPMLKVRIKSVKTTTEFYYGRDDKMYHKEVLDNKSVIDMSWAKKEFQGIL